jgi:Peptidase family M23/Chitinase class I
VGEGQDRVAERARRPVHARRIVAAVLVAVIAVGGFAVGAGAQPPAQPRIVQPPTDNVFPVPVPYEVTFTDSWHACRDGCDRPHKGNDLMADEGVPLVAVEPGVIVRASATDRGLGGVTLWLLGDSGVAYYYAHNSQNLAVEGQRVGRGEVIATVGRTGNARDTAPHVHFQINLCGTTSSSEPCTVDPHPYLQSWSQAQVGGGTDGVGWYEAATGAFGRRNESGSPLSAFPFGTPGADQVPVAGDWDGDGRDSVGLYSRTDAAFSLLDDEGVALPPLGFGQAGRTDVWPVAGDFDGDGRDTVGLYRQAEATFAILVDVGVESAPVSLGTPGRTDALPVVGDWDGDGRDSIGVYQQGDGAVARLDDEGAAMDALVLPAGPEVFPVAGDWDADGREDPAPLRRDAAAFDLPVPNPLDPAAVRSVPIEGGPAVLPIAGDWNGTDLVTQDELRHVFGAVADDPKVVEGLPALNAAMLRAGISTPARKAAFLATLRSESAFRYDAVEAGNPRPFRGRGFIQLTGEANYRGAGEFLGLDLTGNPDLAINGLASPAIAAWYWTVARNINVSADALDMAAVNIAIGFAPSTRRDMVRCADFLTALRYFSGGDVPEGVNCERTPASRLLAFSAILPNPFRPGASSPSGTASVPPSSIPADWAPTTVPSVAPSDPETAPTAPPGTGGPAGPVTTAPPSTGVPPTAPPTSTNPTPSQPPSSEPPTTATPTTAPVTSSPPTSETTTTGTPTTTGSTTTTLAVDPDSTTTSSLDSSTSD